jgi:ketosteroid isomerase-like protein
MSQENVELVRRAVEAFNRRDFAALADYSHEELEFVSVLAAVDAEAAEFRGRETWVNYFAVMDETWDGWQVADLQVWDAGDDQVAAILHMRGTGKQSGALSTRRSGSRTGSGRGASCGECVPTSTPTRPSKPWGCASRRG